jgi:flavorubredoxin
MIECITNGDIKYIGVNDPDLDLFESQYVVPEGVSYNSYVILDEKIAVMDTVDSRKTEEWLHNLAEALGDKTPTYLVVQHMEPDHAASIGAFMQKYPNTSIVATAQAIKMLPLYFEHCDFATCCIPVKENDTLSLGRHTLRFIMAPMVHWPEVMVTFDEKEKALFSADAFGKFGPFEATDDWTCEARRYYFNIVGKYGTQVQSLLKKLSGIDITTICPLHGPVLHNDLAKYISLYDTWSSYRPEDEGVLVAYASIHGNTAQAALKLAEILKAKGCPKVAVSDLTRDDQAEAVEDAFRYSKMVLAASTYDASVFPPMHHFLHHLQSKNYSNRRVGLIENGSWAPLAAKVMTGTLQQMKGIEIVAPTVTIRGSLKQTDIKALEALADALLATD